MASAFRTRKMLRPISLPVIGEGLLAQLVGLRAAGLTFAFLVAALSATVLILLARTYRPGAPAGARARSMAHAGSAT
jgi:multisubunit Na+/H+ antiporter MnhB subunit